MQLTLKYRERATHVLSGAFIRGNTPDSWLPEVNAWQVPLERLVCFIIAQNNNPLHAAGLFVIFHRDELPGILQVRHPYTMLGKKLFIPVDAELSPAISEQELQSLLIWDYQVFHPTIGFIGFERSDRIDLSDLLQYQEPRNIYWGYARPGHQPWIPLRQIGVQQLSAQDVFDSFKEHINNKPLTDIPKTNKTEVPGWLNNPVASGLFKGLYTLLSRLSSIIPAGLFGLGAIFGSGSGGGGSTNDDDKKPGLFKRITNWMEEKIEDLEKQRDSELKRLSDLFDKDTDEALQYAIPLNSPYLNRGTAAPSANLSKRSTKFNLGGLGGGQAVDGWNVDNYYEDLRTKYLKAAQKAMEEKDYKKAAYIYAHLLGDFVSAAATLRKGKYYREAAVLYKEHVNNLSLAAACYEEGGLLSEAIEIYTELNQHEKAGDLYRELGQEEPALNCYEKCVEAAGINKDSLEEARIITDKIGDKPRAKDVLLSGWHDSEGKQNEACLVKYFDLVADDRKDDMHSVVKTFYAGFKMANKRMAFLNVIDTINQKYRSTELENACQGIAYEIVSEQVSSGNPASLHALKNFVTGDQLLTPDTYRFVHTFKEAPKQKPAPTQWQLMSEAQWKKALVWRNQLVLLGERSSGLELARMSWDGTREHVIWSVANKSDSPSLLLADPRNTNHIILYDWSKQSIEKRLSKNKHFPDELIVSRPNFLPIRSIGICMDHGKIFVFHRGVEEVDLYLSIYSLNGEDLGGHRCIFKADWPKLPSVFASEMFSCGDSFYVACGHLLLRIFELGFIEVLYHASGLIHRMIVSEMPDGLVKIAIAFDDKVEIIITGDEYYNKPGAVDGIKAVDLAFLSDHLVVAEEKAVQVISDNNKMKWEMETKNNVVAVFPGPNRDQLGILESNGKITLHNISQSE